MPSYLYRVPIMKIRVSWMSFLHNGKTYIPKASLHLLREGADVFVVLTWIRSWLDSNLVMEIRSDGKIFAQKTSNEISVVMEFCCHATITMFIQEWLVYFLIWPHSLMIFYSNSHLLCFSIFSHSNTDAVIATKFCICHDSSAVVTCAKFCSDPIFRNWIISNCDCDWYWIVDQKSLVRCSPSFLLILFDIWWRCQ